MGFIAKVIQYMRENVGTNSFNIKLLTPIIIFIIVNWLVKDNMTNSELFLNFVITFLFGGLYVKFVYSEILEQVKKNRNLVKHVVGIGFILMIIILIMIFSYLNNNQAFLHSSNIFLKLFLLILLSIPLYSILKNKDFIKKGSHIIKILFYGLFLIPCVIVELINKFINNYRENKLSKFVMAVILLEIVVLCIMVVLMKRKRHKLFVNKSNYNIKKINDKLKMVNKAINELDYKIQKMKMFDIKKRSTDKLWSEIRKESLYLKNNENKLKKLLLDSGFRKYEECGMVSDKNDAEVCREEVNRGISYIQNNMNYILNYEEDLEGLKEEKKKLERSLKNINYYNEGILLLDKPSSLDRERILNNPSEMNDKIFIGNDIIYEYSISLWVFLHSQSGNYAYKSNKNYTILNYNNRPKIEYNLKEGILRFIIKGNSEYLSDVIIHEERNIKLQKWNNLVINYANGVYDIFINNELVNTFSGVVPYMEYSDLVIGENRGITGGIRDVIYYPYYLSKKKIEDDYNKFKK